jgi:enterochelin esterase-like enzyme
MIQSRFVRRVLAIVALSACGDAQETAQPSAAPGTPMPPTQTMLPTPANNGAAPEVTPSEGATPGAPETPVSEGIDDAIERAPQDPNAPADGPEDGTDEPSAPAAGDGEPDVGQPIPTIAPPGFPAGSPPRLVPVEFVGPITGRSVLFNVYLPPGYDSGTTSYPVLYDLHGLTDSRDTNPGPVIRSFEAGMRAGVVGPLIVVFPQSFADGYYADSRDGARPGETQMIRELIPFVESSFRTLSHRARRGISGFSMGGFGALAYATKYPERFSIGIGYDSALDTWATLVGRRAYIAAAAFGNDESAFDQISPWASATRNAATLTDSVTLRIVPGVQYRDFNVAFQTHLTTLGIPHGFTQTDCPHDYNCLIDREGASSWALIQAEFTEPATTGAP